MKATEKNLKKCAIDAGFVLHMEALGFSLGPDDLWFYRRRKEYLDVIQFWIGSSKKYMTIPIMTTTDEILEARQRTRGIIKSFPNNFIDQLGRLSHFNLRQNELSDLWNIETTEEREKTFQQLPEQMTKVADPWLKSINSSEKLYESIDYPVKAGAFGPTLRKILLGTEE